MKKDQFDVLTLIAQGGGFTQRELSEKIGRSVGTVNKVLKSLTELRYISGNNITDEGQKALEPYRVKRAVFIAAGFGSRLVPITLNTPKPLVRVNGQRIIDSLLDAVYAAGIEEVYIVRGYLGEQFDQLLIKYPGIKFIENPIYNEANNISSVLYAKDLLSGAYVFEADLLLYSPSLITKYQYGSNYLGVAVEETDDWCFKVSGGYITSCQIGGTGCFHMFGISYWSEADGEKLKNHVEQVFKSPGGKERYFDQVAFDYFLSEYKIFVRPCKFTDIVEIDTFRELKALDPAYRT